MYKRMLYHIGKSSAASLVPLSELIGLYKVGASALKLVDSSRTDTFAPTVQPRKLAISLFYLTEDIEDCSLALQFQPLTAPLLHPPPPLLIFGPGLGNARTFYSAELEEISSHGWNIVSIDHPHDARTVELPDGHAVFANEPIISNDTVGAFGHSFGGATALQLLLNDTRFAVGANFYGILFGSAIEEGTGFPFDETWPTASANLRGFNRQYAMNDTEHGVFTDFPTSP
ncbi:hypothetical protein F5B22DRAFT_633046 [Xylaria bambusicola]|uniref:uncharacterized protein n=1 Tax=Xylaria bambusicola TaxID=326684 RepID=UPI0020086519|nr:uncharacterized protein F5B22DRAFT_633046 [Xylaria bambusicola]KAI0526596.1 hypothetical protein F5B22DRAFT_633046 [Xylaria bambusicola]